MNPETLRDQLSRLHEELKTARSVDPRSSELLIEVLADIHRLLDSTNTPSAVEQPSAPPAPATLTDRLEKVAVQFEVDHPALASSSRRLIDLLGKAGL